VLTVALVSGPTGLVVTNGVLAWAPTEAQGPSTNTVRVSVGDGVTVVTNAFTLVVREVNALPVILGGTNATIAPRVVHVQNVSASDPDIPAQAVTLSLIQGPVGLVLTNGTVSWSPTLAQAATTNLVRLVASDGVETVTNSFTLVVTSVSGGGSTVSSIDDAQLSSVDAAQKLQIRRVEADGPGMEIEWIGLEGTLEAAPAPDGPWVPVGKAPGIHRVPFEGEARYFRVRN
jgi:hypothetical protein